MAIAGHVRVAKRRKELGENVNVAATRYGSMTQPCWGETKFIYMLVPSYPQRGSNTSKVNASIDIVIELLLRGASTGFQNTAIVSSYNYQMQCSTGNHTEIATEGSTYTIPLAHIQSFSSAYRALSIMETVKSPK